MNILIAGNSYAADWTKKYPEREGWPNFLEKKYKVHNVAECGVGEYKVYEQLKNLNIHNFQFVIISHAQSTRIHTRKHPLWHNDTLMKNCDLIYSDLHYHSKKIKNFFNNSLKSAEQFFNYHYDDDYQKFVYCLILEKINFLLNESNVFVVNDYVTENFEKKYYGNCNHLNYEGNKIILSKIEEKMSKLNI